MKARPQKRKYDYQKILELSKQGYSLNQIACLYGTTKFVIGQICRKYGLGGVLSQKANRAPEDPKKYVESYLPEGFSYVKGYTGSDGLLTIKCDKCGESFEASMSWIRNVRRKNMHCPNCDAIEKAEREELERFIRETAAKERITIAGINSAIREAEREEKKRTVKCEICGKTFTTYRLTQVCCSAECGKKRYNRISSHRKDARIADDKRIDKDITALGLFDRDGGVCWICGKRCDLTDYTVKDGTIICGNKYPSIDHIIPICELSIS